MNREKQAETCKNCAYCDEHYSVDEEYVELNIDPTERIFEPPAEVSRQC